MDFDRMLKERIEEIDVPKELEPDNIALMLRAVPSKMQQEQRAVSVRPSRQIIMRTLTAAAACIALAAGFVAYMDQAAPHTQLESEILYKDVEQPQTYDDLFDIYTQISLAGGGQSQTASGTEYGDGAFAGTDIVKAEDGTVYYADGGSIYSLTADGVTVCAEIGSADPAKIYIDGNRLIVISRKTIYSSFESAVTLQTSEVPDEDAITADGNIISGTSAKDHSQDQGDIGRICTVADIYDISGGNAAALGSYMQSGDYISSRIAEGQLYLVTDCVVPHSAEPGKETDLDGYVPCYFIDGEKKYVAAEDIIVPANASSTGYTVVSSVDADRCSGASVKALLGSSSMIYCTDSTLYTASVGEKDQEYTTITSFDITNGIEYKASGSVEGTLLKYGGMDEYDGCLRVATRNISDGTKGTDIFVLDSSLSVVNSAGRLLAGENTRNVSFDGRYASVYVPGRTNPELIVDLASNPPVISEDMMNSGASMLHEFSDGLTLGLGQDEDGLVLSMFDSATGTQLTEISFAHEDDIVCDALTHEKMLLVDSERKLIGVPLSYSDGFGVHSIYYLFSYDGGNGFAVRGNVEYIDLDDSRIFKAATVSGDTLYIISDARIVLTRTSDMKVIKSFEIN